jgi:hypothetical protein
MEVIPNMSRLNKSDWALLQDEANRKWIQKLLKNEGKCLAKATHYEMTFSCQERNKMDLVQLSRRLPSGCQVFFGDSFEPTLVIHLPKTLPRHFAKWQILLCFLAPLLIFFLLFF